MDHKSKKGKYSGEKKEYVLEKGKNWNGCSGAGAPSGNILLVLVYLYHFINMIHPRVHS